MFLVCTTHKRETNAKSDTFEDHYETHATEQEAKASYEKALEDDDLYCACTASILEGTDAHWAQSKAEQEQTLDALESMVMMHDLLMSKMNIGASHFDAQCFSEMNDVPLQAREVLKNAGRPWQRAKK